VGTAHISSGGFSWKTQAERENKANISDGKYENMVDNVSGGGNPAFFVVQVYRPELIRGKMCK
jgi:hypothetical protein